MVNQNSSNQNTVNFSVTTQTATPFTSAFGSGALINNASGTDNTAVGKDALRPNTFGTASTAVGSGALSSSITGNANT
ncbi:MAG: hypothetical protein JSS32_02885, partial [Verrucomicrobia bacterium]|nr:hypothetical protein [Verrucomicrobiota bacterium]